MKLCQQFSFKKILSISLFTIILSCCVYFFSITFFEKSAYDNLSKISANESGTEDIINIVIDNDSIKEIGAWPWKRSLYADIIEYLSLSGAKVIAFDAVLSAPGDKDNDTEFLNRIKNIDNLVVGVNFSKLESLTNNKEELSYFENQFAINVQDNRNKDFIKKTDYSAYQEMFPNYIQNVKRIGAVNAHFDSDGIVRTFEPVIYMNGKYYPSLPLAVYIKAKNINKIIINKNNYITYSDKGIENTFHVDTSQGKTLQYIKWLVPHSKISWVPHKQIKASSVINSYRNMKNNKLPLVEPSLFKDKIVVIGATANALYDLKITSMTINMPGSAIQATSIDNLLSNDSVIRVNHFINIIVMLCFVAIIFLLIFYLAPLLSFISILLLGFLYFYLAIFCYAKGIAINVVTPYVFFILSIIVAYSYKFMVEDYQNEKLQSAMKKYINTTVVDNIIQNADGEVKLGGKKSEITVLMADIRGFTRFSEKLEPEIVTNLLNEYFGIMLPIIEEHNGYVNKFIGDAILAIFNEPVKDKNHPINAILCANKMLSAARELRKKWKSEDKPDIGISIGINTGNAFIGNIGTPSHMEYTVIGDTVNVASRIEAQNRQFNTQLLISDTTYEYAKDMLDVIKISSVEIRGREKHMDIYEIIKIIDNNEDNR